MNRKKGKTMQDQSIARRDLLKYAGTGAIAIGLHSSTTLLQAQAHQIESVVDMRVIKRVAQNTARLLVDFSTDFEAFVNQAMPLRLQIFSDVMRLFNALDPRDRGCLLSLLTLEVRDQISPELLQEGEQEKGGPAFSVGVGQEDLSECRAMGIEARSASTTVGAGVCPQSDLSGIEGGGFWARFEY